MKKNRLFAAAAFLTCAALGAAACAGPHTHEWGEWTQEKAPTCEEAGTERRECKLDPTHVETRPVGALGHKWSAEWSQDEREHYHVCENGCGEHRDEAAHTYQNGACTDCGYLHREHSFSSGICTVCGRALYTEEGGKILFGEYPQSEVKEAALISELTAAAGELPTEDNARAWTSYGYYDDSGEVADYMWYIDVESGGERYRGVYFTEERGYRTTNSLLSAQEDNGYLTETVYWFRFEPIVWRVLESADGTAFLMSDVILDTGHYYHDTTSRGEGEETVYPNNYKESDIRAWLLGNFYDTAFGADEKEIIETATVDNQTGGDNTYACEDTKDKVFLPSYAEVLNADLGFGSDWGADASRQLTATDYAKAQGIQVKDDGASGWWLRTPENHYNGKYVYKIAHDGTIMGGMFAFGGGEAVNYTWNGIVPALRLHL